MNWSPDTPVTFAHPWVLLFLLAIPLLAFLKGRRGASPAVVFSSLQAMQSLGHPARTRAGALLASLLLLSLALFITALARPQQGRVIRHVEASGIDIMLAIDVSLSMMAEDFTIGGRTANRLEAVKKVTREFIEARPSDRIGIVAFSGYPYLVSPLTLDHGWLLQNLERLRVGLVDPGTAIGSAIASAANRLKDKESKSRIIVLLTDGDNNAGKVTPNTAAEAARALGIKIYAICAGSTGTVRMPLQDQFGRTYYEEIRVDVDEEALKQIAKIGNGQFYRATDSKSLERIFAQIDELEKTTVEMTQYKEYRDLFPWLLMPGLALLGLHALLGQTVFRRTP